VKLNELFDNLLNEEVEIFTHKDYKILSTVHSGERFEERFPNKPSMDKFFTDVIDIFDKHLVHFKKLAKDENGKTIPIPPFIVKSKSLNQSVLIAFRPFRKIFTIVTFFEIGRDRPKPGTEVLMIEDVFCDIEIFNSTETTL
jgi:hypothetical protein